MAYMAAVLKDGGKSFCMERIRRGMTIQELAKRSGLSVTVISRMDGEVTKAVRPLSAQKLCVALGMTFDDLFTIQLVARQRSGMRDAMPKNL